MFNNVIWEPIARLLSVEPPYGNQDLYIYVIVGTCITCSILSGTIVYFLERKRNKFWFTSTSMAAFMGALSLPIVFLYFGITEIVHRALGHFPTEAD